MKKLSFLKKVENKSTKYLNTLLIVLITLITLYGREAEAVHKGAGDLVCGSCHTMHNSQGSGSNVLGGTSGGSLVLLRSTQSGREQIHMLCLSCHAENGSGATASTPDPTAGVTAPKVFRTTGWSVDADTSDDLESIDFTTIAAGGDFSGTLDENWTPKDGDACAGNPSLGKGHSVGCSNVTPPGAKEGSLSALSCTNCHDPHGTDTTATVSNGGKINKYRNLRTQPVGGGGNTEVDPDGDVYVTVKTYVGGNSSPTAGQTGTNFSGKDDQISSHYWPVTKDGSATSSNAYYAETIGVSDQRNQGISGWCAQCHDLWHEDGDGTTNRVEGPGADQQDWRRHPVNTSIVSDRPNSGGGVQKTDFTHYSSQSDINKLPAAQDGSTIQTSDPYYADSGDDRVFCLSCHWVHGGPYNDNLRWNYSSSVSAGDQVGNAIPSTVGCQMCHNR